MTTSRRRDEVAAALAEVRGRIAEACKASGRAESEVTVVVVTKYFPASDVALVHGLGVRDVGENRDQEAEPKMARARELLAADGTHPDLTVHFVGQLQTNKARHVARYADVVHSVDRGRLVEALARGAEDAGRVLRVLLQVSLDGDTSRGGALPEELHRLADLVAAHPSLELKGLMAVAPLGADPDESFARLREVASGIRASHPGADWLSAGMSSDLEAAVRYGATHLRVGSAILGSRESLL